MDQVQKKFYVNHEFKCVAGRLEFAQCYRSWGTTVLEWILPVFFQ